MKNHINNLFTPDITYKYYYWRKFFYDFIDIEALIGDIQDKL